MAETPMTSPTFPLSRRALFSVGMAVAVPAGAADPVYDAIRRHLKAVAAVNRDDGSDNDRFTAAGENEIRARDVLLHTMPITMDGIAAYAVHMNRYAIFDEECRDALLTISAAARAVANGPLA